MMSFTVTISGSTDDPTAEHNFAAALQAVVENPDFGVTEASGTFAFAGDVVLLPPVDVPPPAPSVDVLLDALGVDVANLDPSVAGVEALTTDYHALADAIHVNKSELASAAPVSDTPAADAPFVDHEGTVVAL